MKMAYEFKKLSDVDIVETPSETANVLIEEDGVIKKAPKTAVGGGGSAGEVSNSNWDAIIKFGNDSDRNTAINNASFVLGNYDILYTKIEACEMPNILIQWTPDPNNQYVRNYRTYVIDYAHLRNAVLTNTTDYIAISNHYLDEFYIYPGDLIQSYRTPT
jgi:hypothetical protein